MDTLELKRAARRALNIALGIKAQLSRIILLDSDGELYIEFKYHEHCYMYDEDPNTETFSLAMQDVNGTYFIIY